MFNENLTNEVFISRVVYLEDKIGEWQKGDDYSSKNKFFNKLQINVKRIDNSNLYGRKGELLLGRRKIVSQLTYGIRVKEEILHISERIYIALLESWVQMFKLSLRRSRTNTFIVNYCNLRSKNE